MRQYWISGLHVEIVGNGRPLVLLHGNSQSSRMFDRMRPALAARYQTISIDARGHGRSVRADAPLSFAGMADDVDSVMSQLFARGLVAGTALRFALFGFSDGANIAMMFAMEHSTQLSALVLNAGNLVPEGMRSFAHWQIEIAVAALRVVSFLPAAARRREIWDLMLREPQIAPRQLASIGVPTLVLVGEHDVIRREESARIAAAIAGSEFAIVPRAGHMLATRRPRVVVEIVRRFLDRVDSH